MYHGQFNHQLNIYLRLILQKNAENCKFNIFLLLSFLKDISEPETVGDVFVSL